MPGKRLADLLYADHRASHGAGSRRNSSFIESLRALLSNDRVVSTIVASHNRRRRRRCALDDETTRWRIIVASKFGELANGSKFGAGLKFQLDAERRILWPSRRASFA